VPSSWAFMAAEGARERRPAVWPWVVMPLIVLLVFCALYKVHQRSHAAAATLATTETRAPGQQ